MQLTAAMQELPSDRCWIPASWGMLETFTPWDSSAASTSKLLGSYDCATAAPAAPSRNTGENRIVGADKKGLGGQPQQGLEGGRNRDQWEMSLFI